MKKIIITILILMLCGCTANVSKNNYILIKSIQYNNNEMLVSNIDYILSPSSAEYTENYNGIAELSHELTDRNLIKQYQNEIGHYKYETDRQGTRFKYTVIGYKYEIYEVHFYNNCEYFMLKVEKYNSLTDELTVEYSLIRPNSYEISLVSDF